MNTGVIVVDVQGDFTELKNGSLAVKGTDQEFIKKIQEETGILKQEGLPVFATQDWHPRKHISFYTNHKGKKPFDVITLRGKPQVLWPPHCVQETEGAKLLLDGTLFDGIVKKGTEIEFDSYSGFKDDGGSYTPLHQMLKDRGITRTILFGIATDYCVKATALDAIELGYQVMVIKNLSRVVDPDTSSKALQEMQRQGVMLLDELDNERIESSPL